MLEAALAAGLAAGGLRPVVAIYSTFLQRAIDAVIHDVALQNLPVVFCLDRAGVVAADGPTHHGVFDIALLRGVPNLVIMQPRDGHECAAMLAMAFTLDAPVVIRYPRGGTASRLAMLVCRETRCGIFEAAILQESEKPTIALWALGDMIPLAADVALLLQKKGIATTLVDARFIRPVDAGLLRRQAQDGVRLFVTFENGIIAGGFGTAVMETLAQMNVDIPVHRVGWPDEFIAQAASSDELLQRYHLTTDAIAEAIVNITESST